MSAFAFVSRKDIDLMEPVWEQIDGFNQTDRSRIGDWGILPLCCGWAASQNLNRMGVMIEAIQPQRDIARRVPYLTLAIVLNSFGKNKDIVCFHEWLAEHNSSWTELFFAVGILKAEALRLQGVASVLVSFQREPVREQFRALLEMYGTMAHAPA